MGTEIWRTPIVNGEPYENYQVSNFGRIKSLNYKRTGKSELLQPRKDTHGYLQVCLSKNGGKWFSLHRVVAETFLPNPENKPQVNHKIEGDEGKTINMVFFNDDGTIDKERTTIEWVTVKENHNYGTHNERSAKTRSKKVLQFTLDGEFIREWPSTAEVGRNGYNFSHIAACCRGERKSAYGFKWCYV